MRRSNSISPLSQANLLVTYPSGQTLETDGAVPGLQFGLPALQQFRLRQHMLCGHHLRRQWFCIYRPSSRRSCQRSPGKPISAAKTSATCRQVSTRCESPSHSRQQKPARADTNDSVGCRAERALNCSQFCTRYRHLASVQQRCRRNRDRLSPPWNMVCSIPARVRSAY